MACWVAPKRTLPVRRYSLCLPRIALDTFPESEYTICMNLHIFRSDELPTEKLASLHRALGHPVRLLILHVLLQGEACICQTSSTWLRGGLGV